MWSSSFVASPHFSSPPKLSLFLSSSSSSFPNQNLNKFLCFAQNPSSTIGFKTNKRQLNLSILTLLFNGFLLDNAKSISESGDLQRYSDFKDGFTLLVPSSWIKVFEFLREIGYKQHIMVLVCECCVFFLVD